MAYVGGVELAQNDLKPGKGRVERLWVSDNNLVGNMELCLILPAEKRIQLDGCGEKMVAPQHFSLAVLVAEEEFVL